MGRVLRNRHAGAAPPPAGAEDRHRATAAAAAAQLGADVVFSHVTAALLHGLPVWMTPLDRLHVTRDRRSGARRSRHLAVHAASLDSNEIELVDGLPVHPGGARRRTRPGGPAPR